MLWLAPVVVAWIDDIDIDLEEIERLPAVIFGFVVFDAVIPIFPSESVLTAAANLAAQPDSTIELWTIVVAGALGAVVEETRSGGDPADA